MKGSWFVWDRTRAHKDWCQWRAPYWHGGRVMSKSSHRNYHLGFRCCRSLKGNTETGADKDAGDKKATDEAAPKD
jgi:hypothetical protein